MPAPAKNHRLQLVLILVAVCHCRLRTLYCRVHLVPTRWISKLFENRKVAKPLNRQNQLWFLRTKIYGEWNIPFAFRLPYWTAPFICAQLLQLSADLWSAVLDQLKQQVNLYRRHPTPSLLPLKKLDRFFTLNFKFCPALLDFVFRFEQFWWVGHFSMSIYACRWKIYRIS